MDSKDEIDERSAAVYAQVGRRIRGCRHNRGLTLQQLAERSGLSAAYLGQIERDVKKASLRTLAAVAAALEVPVSKLFDPAGPLAPFSSVWRIEHLLRSHPRRERALLLSTLRHLGRELQMIRRAGP